MVAEKRKLTKSVVDAEPVPASGETRIWDREIPGFCIRIYASGRRVYAIKYRVDGKQAWLTLGTHAAKAGDGGVTADRARQLAAAARVAANEGHDVAAAKQARRRDLLVPDLVERYITEGPAERPGKRASSWAADAANLRLHVAPLLIRKRARDVTPSDIASAVSDIAAGKTAAPKKQGRGGVTKGGMGAARRSRAAASSMFTWAKERGFVDANPVSSSARLPKAVAKERFLSQEEARRLLDTLDEMIVDGALKSDHAAIFRLLLLTGARRGEIVGLQWSEIDESRRQLILPPERTKTGGSTGVHRIHLNDEALAVLAGLTRSGSSFVFPSTSGTSATGNVARSWDRVKERAGLSGLRMHDLRHSFASFALAAGGSLFLVGRALGHTDSRTTERYAHHTDEALQTLASATGRHLRERK
ncbi:tyrosine-type recombinase/integrase [Brevundimonas sp.]|uniref:tyrosine-type recombinase/integrase n=1 Tax=Brevundimonas sp. TaxID=1871086 RepID=UPI003BAC59A7